MRARFVALCDLAVVLMGQGGASLRGRPTRASSPPWSLGVQMPCAFHSTRSAGSASTVSSERSLIEASPSPHASSSSPRYGGARYQHAIKKLVDGATSAGFAVILDLHWNAPGTQNAVEQLPGPDLDHAPLFWTQVATAFMAYSNVRAADRDRCGA